MRPRLAAVLTAALLLGCQSAVPLARPTDDPDETFVKAGTLLPALQSSLTSDPTDEDSYKPAISPAGGVTLRKSTNSIVLRVPAAPLGPRRVGIQVGHWKIDEVPPEQKKLLGQTGAIWEGVHEVDVNMDVAKRVATMLTVKGIVVDLLPATIPEGYVADAFVAIHADSDGVGELSGFKLAHGPLRGPFEDRLVTALRDAYGKATGLEYDEKHITVDMTYYYPFNYLRFLHATSAFTPAAILEMGYISSDDDREFLTEHADKVAEGIANGLMRFLADTPRSQIFRDDIVIKLPPPAAPSSNP